uniref:U6 snRNA phosphodiesterase n=2 Tax=Rhodnius TaxID=13248 RepID=A0A4P6D7C4_RHOPR
MFSSLSLLNEYESEEEFIENVHPENTSPRLPLPNSFKLVSQEEVKDDPKKHEGRIRSYPHQRGNWNSLIFVPYRKNGPFDLLRDQIIDLCQPKIEMKKIEEPHISLTRTFILLYHWIDDFVAAVKKSLGIMLRYDVQFDGLKIYCNEERNRTFLAMSVGFGKMEITKSVQLLDKCLSEYKLHPFYNEASFHMSFLWCLGDKKKELEELLPEMNKVFEANLNDSFDVTIPVTRYICKIGNKMYNINLK